MKLIPFVFAGTLFIATGQGAAASDFIQGSWLCISPEVYGQAMERLAGKNDEETAAVRADLETNKQCTYFTLDDLRKVITGVRIMQTKGDTVRVLFGLQIGDQMPVQTSTVTNEAFARVAGWTARANLSED